jgi:hypothetical protein
MQTTDCRNLIKQPTFLGVKIWREITSRGKQTKKKVEYHWSRLYSYSAEWDDNWRIVDWKGFLRKRCWPNRRNYPAFCLDGLSKIKKTFGHESKSPYREIKQVPPKYGYGVLASHEQAWCRILVPGACISEAKSFHAAEALFCLTRSWSATCRMACVNEQHRPVPKADLTDKRSDVLPSLPGTNMILWYCLQHRHYHFIIDMQKG